MKRILIGGYQYLVCTKGSRISSRNPIRVFRPAPKMKLKENKETVISHADSRCFGGIQWGSMTDISNNPPSELGVDAG